MLTAIAIIAITVYAGGVFHEFGFTGLIMDLFAAGDKK